jgi:hypothetical protein
VAKGKVIGSVLIVLMLGALTLAVVMKHQDCPKKVESLIAHKSKTVKEFLKQRVKREMCNNTLRDFFSHRLFPL